MSKVKRNIIIGVISFTTTLLICMYVYDIWSSNNDKSIISKNSTYKVAIKTKNDVKIANEAITKNTETKKTINDYVKRAEDLSKGNDAVDAIAELNKAKKLGYADADKKILELVKSKQITDKKLLNEINKKK